MSKPAETQSGNNIAPRVDLLSRPFATAYPNLASSLDKSTRKRPAAEPFFLSSSHTRKRQKTEPDNGNGITNPNDPQYEYVIKQLLPEYVEMGSKSELLRNFLTNPSNILDRSFLIILITATEQNDLETIDLVLQAKPDLFQSELLTNKLLPLNISVNRGFEEATEILLKSTPIHDIFPLMKKPPEPQDQVAKAVAQHYLAHSSFHGDIRGINHAILCGVDVNYQNIEGNTALHIAASQGHKNAVDTLLHAQADFAFKNLQNLIPEQLAVMGGFLDVVETLRNTREESENAYSQERRQAVVRFASQAPSPSASTASSSLATTTLTSQGEQDPHDRSY